MNWKITDICFFLNLQSKYTITQTRNIYRLYEYLIREGTEPVARGTAVGSLTTATNVASGIVLIIMVHNQKLEIKEEGDLMQLYLLLRTYYSMYTVLLMGTKIGKAQIHTGFFK